jgi:hypothetical protein
MMEGAELLVADQGERTEMDTGRARVESVERLIRAGIPTTPGAMRELLDARNSAINLSSQGAFEPINAPLRGALSAISAHAGFAGFGADNDTVHQAERSLREIVEDKGSDRDYIDADERRTLQAHRDALARTPVPDAQPAKLLRETLLADLDATLALGGVESRNHGLLAEKLGAITATALASLPVEGVIANDRARLIVEEAILDDLDIRTDAFENGDDLAAHFQEVANKALLKAAVESLGGKALETLRAAEQIRAQSNERISQKPEMTPRETREQLDAITRLRNDGLPLLAKMDVQGGAANYRDSLAADLRRLDGALGEPLGFANFNEESQAKVLDIHERTRGLLNQADELREPLEGRDREPFEADLRTLAAMTAVLPVGSPAARMLQVLMGGLVELLARNDDERVQARRAAERLEEANRIVAKGAALTRTRVREALDTRRRVQEQLEANTPLRDDLAKLEGLLGTLSGLDALGPEDRRKLIAGDDDTQRVLSAKRTENRDYATPEERRILQKHHEELVFLADTDDPNQKLLLETVLGGLDEALQAGATETRNREHLGQRLGALTDSALAKLAPQGALAPEEARAAVERAILDHPEFRTRALDGIDAFADAFQAAADKALQELLTRTIGAEGIATFNVAVEAIANARGLNPANLSPMERLDQVDMLRKNVRAPLEKLALQGLGEDRRKELLNQATDLEDALGFSMLDATALQGLLDVRSRQRGWSRLVDSTRNPQAVVDFREEIEVAQKKAESLQKVAIENSDAWRTSRRSSRCAAACCSRAWTSG